MIQSFISHLKVDKQIVPLLSKTTYTNSFAYAIRELVSNAYDADALTLHISISDDLSIIEIEDDGNGMTKEEFEHYCTIAGQKQDFKLSRKYKRKRIGQFGIGFLSVFPFCESLEVTTTVENSDEILTAIIPAVNFFNTKINTEVTEIPIQGNIQSNSKQRNRHYTIIRLINPTYLVKQHFKNSHTNERKTIKRLRSLERFKWELQEDLPIAYKSNSLFSKHLKFDEPIGINVFLNGKQLFRNEFGTVILLTGNEKLEKFEFKYLIATNYDAIDPIEARGLKIRVNNVGVGKRTVFELNRSRGFTHLHWISGEVILSEYSKNYLNIGREAFVSSPETEEFFESIASKLREQAYAVDKIADAEKELIGISTLSNKKISHSPAKQIVDDNIKKLESMGFQVRASNGGATSTNHIKVDKQNKIVYVDNLLNISKENIFLFNKSYSISYNKWDYKNNSEPSCRLIGNTNIEINENYPLFKSKKYGALYKKLHVYLLIMSTQSTSSKTMLDKIMQNFLDEFQE